MSHYLGDYTSLCDTNFDGLSPHRFKMFVDTRDVHLAPHLLTEGRWEMWLTKLMASFMKGAIFVDIGANVGWYSLLAAACGAKKIYAAEPNVRLQSLLKRTMRVNGFENIFELWHGALGDEDGTLPFVFSYEEAGGGALRLPGGEPLELCKDLVLSVPVRKADDVFGQAMPDGHVVVKVDVEGFEPRVILGMQNILKNRACTVFVEHHSDDDGTRKQREMLDFFESNGYSLGLVGYDSQITKLAREKLVDVPDIETLCFRKFQR